MKIIFFFLLLGLSFESLLPKYGSLTVSSNDVLYLDISDYSKGEDIELEVSSHCIYGGNTLQVMESNEFFPSSYDFRSVSPYNTDISSESIYYKTQNYYKYTFYYKTQKTKSYQYLIIVVGYTTFCNDIFEVKHIGTGGIGKNAWLYILGIGSFIAFVAIVVCCIKKKQTRPNVIFNEPQINYNQPQPLYPPQSNYIPPSQQIQQPQQQNYYY